MRDINRIDKITNIINEIWKLDPDLRFNQLVENLNYLYIQEKSFPAKEIWVYEESLKNFVYNGTDKSIFYVEDDNYYDFLQSYLKKRKENKNDRS